MKKLKFIYNPSAGDGMLKNRLDYVIERFQKSGFAVMPYRSTEIGLLEQAFFDVYEDYDAICVSGGDGTISSVVNIMAARRLNIPLGVFPFGTANDFATYLNIPRDIDTCCELVLKGHTRPMDIGRVNDRYFVNVCSAGLLTDISYKTDTNLKNALGKIAYYIKGIEEIPKFTSFKMRMEYDGNVIEDSFLLFLILNGGSAGGFAGLAPYARIDDGKLDVLAIKASPIANILALFLKILRGEHVGDPNLYHFQTDRLQINCGGSCETDIDGERGPDFPLEIEVKKHFLRVFTDNTL